MRSGWTRIEVEYRPKGGDVLPDDLFDGLTVDVWPSLKGLHLPTRVWLAYAQHAPTRELPIIMSAAPERVRRVLERVEPLSPSPREVYLACRDELRLNGEWIMRLGGTVPEGVRLFGEVDR